MKYYKLYREIQRQKAIKRLKHNLVMVAAVLVVLALLGIAGAVGR